MGISRIRIFEKFDESKQYIKLIKDLVSHSQEEYISLPVLQLQGERLFEIISQIMLDVCSHIVSHSALEAPKSYADCMNALHSLGIIEENEIQNYRHIIKMRNLISHRYGKIKHISVYTGLSNLLVDFKSYKNAVIKWLKNSSKLIQ